MGAVRILRTPLVSIAAILLGLISNSGVWSLISICSRVSYTCTISFTTLVIGSLSGPLCSSICAGLPSRRSANSLMACMSPAAAFSMCVRAISRSFFHVLAAPSPRPAADEPPASIVITRFSPVLTRPTPGLTSGLAGRNRVGGTMSASATHWRAAHVNWFTRRGRRKRYRHRYARACAPILSVGSGAHSRDHAVDRTGGSDLGAVPHRSNDLSRRGLCCRALRVAADIGLLAHHGNHIHRRPQRIAQRAAH